MTNNQGQRKKCAECGGEVIVTNAGDGTLQCCNKEMEDA